MKIRIRPYLKFLLIENTIYIVLGILLIVALLFIPSYFVNDYIANKEKINQLDEELRLIQSKRNALVFLSSSKSENLDDYYNLVTSLIPDSENYFSILYALDNLSEITNFKINSYTINPRAQNINKVSIKVTGTGNHEDFLNFLKEYNVAGGRLITAEKIGLGGSEFTGIMLDLNFYSKKSSLYQTNKEDYQKILAKLDKIKDKVRFTFNKEETEELKEQEATTESYPIKSNPF